MSDTAKDQDYEVLSPPTDLRKKVRILSPREAKKFDPVKAAETALERLSRNFGDWMEAETQTLAGAWQTIQSDGLTEETLDSLYQSAHNIKGQAQTLGFPLVGQVASSFCQLIESLPRPEALPMAITGQFVEAIRAMVAEGARDTDNKTGVALLETLQSVTDEFVEQFPKSSDADAG